MKHLLCLLGSFTILCLISFVTAQDEVTDDGKENGELFRTTDSKMCRENCIDAGHYFCPSKYDGYYGTCCKLGE